MTFLKGQHRAAHVGSVKMAMDGMDMSGMSGGMDMSSDGMFKGTNMKIARLYWYIVAGVVAFLFLQRCIEWTRTRMA